MSRRPPRCGRGRPARVPRGNHPYHRGEPFKYQIGAPLRADHGLVLGSRTDPVSCSTFTLTFTISITISISISISISTSISISAPRYASQASFCSAAETPRGPEAQRSRNPVSSSTQPRTSPHVRRPSRDRALHRLCRHCRTAPTASSRGAYDEWQVVWAPLPHQANGVGK